MLRRKSATRVALVTVACVVLFVMGSAYAYVQRGCLAVGGEYALCLIPPFTLACEWLLKGDE